MRSKRRAGSCSAGRSRAWYAVGQITCPGEGGFRYGVHASGNVDRTVRPGAHPAGTAIRFLSFASWGL